MSITVYLHYKPVGGEEKTSKIVIPKGWTTTKSVADVLGLFAKSYNAKNPDSAIEVSEYHLESSDGDRVYSNIVCGTVLGDHSDYFIKEGAHESVRKKEAINMEGKLRCKNYGCNQYYAEEENTDTSCTHHSGPPVFHDTAKFWSCCSGHKAYDFESFQAIAGCATGRHSQANSGAAISASPNATAPREESAASSSGLKRIEDYNNANPTAASAQAAAARLVTAPRKSSRTADGIQARCQRKGCQKLFDVASNVPGSRECVYHRGQPVFHDAVKFWSCCPGARCHDFEAFLAVPGCATGLHDDGVIDLDEASATGAQTETEAE